MHTTLPTLASAVQTVQTHRLHYTYTAPGNALPGSKPGIDASGAPIPAKTAPGTLTQAVTSNLAGNAAANAVPGQEGTASGITKSAISAGTIILTDEAGQLAKTGQSAAGTLASLNRDVATANGAIEKIFDLKDIERDQEYRKVLSDVAQQAAPIIYNEVGTYLAGQPVEVKVAVHALIGGLLSKAVGGEFGSGAAGAAAATLAVETFGKELRELAGGNKDDQDALIMLVGLTVGKIAALAGGGNGAESNAAAITAKLGVEHNYLKHAEILGLGKARKECNGGKGSAAACSEVERLKMLDRQRDADLAACTYDRSDHCNNLRQEVRSAYAEIIRKSDEEYGVFGFRPIDYQIETGKTQFEADKTISTIDRALGMGTGLANTIVDGIAEMAKGAVIYIKTVAGDEAAGDAFGKTVDGAGRVLSSPELWATILENSTKEQHAKIADAYERGDGVALGKIGGEVLSNFVGGAGTIRKVGNVAEVTKGANRALPGEAGHFGANTVTPGGTGTALTGHGGKFVDSPSFVVPEGSAVTLPRPNISILDRTGQYIEKGDWEGLAALAKTNPRVARDIEGMTTWLPGAKVPGYTLFPPDKGINLFSRSHSVYQPTPLQQILEPNLGCVQWAACTSFLPYTKP